MKKIIVKTKELYLRKININDIDNGWLEWVNNKSLCKYLLNSNGYTRDELIKYIAHINPKVLVLMHGEPASIKILAEKFPDKEVYTPHLDEELSVG